MKTTLPILIVLLTLFTSCQTVKYIADFDESQDFTQYKTYNLMQWNEKNNKYISGINKERILRGIHKEMEKRGYSLSEKPDIMLNVNVIVEERKGTHAYTTYMGGYYTPFGYGVTTYQEYTYLVGTLIIDMFEESSKKQIWHGAAMGEVEEKRERTEEDFHRIISRILKRYPIPPLEK